MAAHEPRYKIYPFLDKLDVLAEDRGHIEIVALLYQVGTAFIESSNISYPLRQLPFA